jgi:hypothetical protein
MAVTRTGEQNGLGGSGSMSALRRNRRPLARLCLDWSERWYHLAGVLGDALAARCFESRWIARLRLGRAVRLTDRGRVALRDELGLDLRHPAQPENARAIAH